MGRSPKAKPPAESPLRAALAAKTNLRTFHDISIADSDVIDDAVRKLATARQLEMAAMLNEDPKVRERAAEVVAEAKADRDACFHRIWFRGLGYTEFDALVALHPPTPEQAADDHIWNPDTFVPALLEACALAQDGSPAGLSADEWAAELADEQRWSRSDRNRVINMALAAQQQTMADAVPKD